MTTTTTTKSSSLSTLSTMVVVDEVDSMETPRRPASTLSDRRLLDPKQNLLIIKRSLSASGRTSPSPILSGPYLTGSSPASSPIRRMPVPLVPTGKEVSKTERNDKEASKTERNAKEVSKTEHDDKEANVIRERSTPTSQRPTASISPGHNVSTSCKSRSEAVGGSNRKNSLSGVEEISLANVTEKPIVKETLKQSKKAFRRDSEVEVTVNLADQLRQTRQLQKGAKRRLSQQSTPPTTSSTTTTSTTATTTTTTKTRARRRTSTGCVGGRPQSVAQRVLQERQNRVLKIPDSPSSTSPKSSSSSVGVSLRRSASQHSLPRAPLADQMRRHVHFGTSNGATANKGDECSHLKPILKKSSSMEIAGNKGKVLKFKADVHFRHV